MMKRTKLLATILAVVMVVGALSVAVSAAVRTGTQLTVHSFSTEQVVGGSVTTDGSAALAVDGNTATAWNDRYSPTESDPPNWIVFDLGSSFTVTGFSELPRQDGYTGLGNGNIKNYTLSYSTNGTDFTVIKSDAFDDSSSAWQATTFTGVTARYIKIEQPNDPADNYVAISEVRVTVADNPATGDNDTMLILILVAAAALVFVVALSKKTVRN
jgi:hypothetical protein